MAVHPSFLTGIVSRAARRIVVTAFLALCPFAVAQPSEPVTIRLWHFFDMNAWHTFGALIEEFNATHPGIRVVPEYQGGYDLLARKILAAIVAGVPPEMATVGSSEIPRLADTGWIVPFELTPEEKNDIFPAIQTAYTYKGKQWAMPIEGAAYGLFYNKRLFREAGLPDRPPATWDELVEFGKALTRDTDGDGRVDQWGFILHDKEVVGESTIFNLYFSNGVTLLNEDETKVTFDTPKVIEVLQLWHDLALKYKITTTNMPVKPIHTERVGMWIGGSWSYGDLVKTLDIGIGAIPPLKRPATLAGPDAAVIGRTSPEKQAASQAFMMWLSEPAQFARVCVELGYLPIRRSIQNEPVYQAYIKDNPEKAVLSNALEYLYIKPLHPAWTEMQIAMHNARARVQQGSASPAQAAAEAQSEAQKVLDAYNREIHFAENSAARLRFHIIVGLIGAALFGLLALRLRKEYKGLRARFQIVNWAGYLLILPQLILFLVFDVFPIGFALYMSFFRWDMLTAHLYTGLDNYLRVFHDPQFMAALRRTLVWVVGTVPVNTALALGIALLLNAKIRGIGFFRLLFYSPSVTSGVALAIIWWWILNGNSGLLNYVFEMVGIQSLLDRAGVGQIDWLNDERYALLGLIIMDWWRALSAFLIFLAALQGIPDSFYEAAAIDGAGRWRQFKEITWPLLMPATFFVVVTTMIAAFQVFEQIYVMTLGEGGPSESTTTVTFYLYKNAFNYFRMGYASAIAYIMGAMILAVTLIQRRYLGKDVQY